MTVNNSDLTLWPRIEAAINGVRLSRAATEWQFPRCHKRNCHSVDHGSPDFVLNLFLEAVKETVYAELLCRATTEPYDALLDALDDADQLEEGVAMETACPHHERAQSRKHTTHADTGKRG